MINRNEKYTVKSFTRMEYHPTENMDLVDERYFETMQKCHDWAMKQEGREKLNFEIHMTAGAKNYQFWTIDEHNEVTWKFKDYTQTDIPLIACWWHILPPPHELE